VTAGAGKGSRRGCAPHRPPGVAGEKPTRPVCRHAGESRHPEALPEAWIPVFAGNDESDEIAVVRGFPRELLIKPPFVLSLSKHERKKARNHGPVTTALRQAQGERQLFGLP